MFKFITAIFILLLAFNSLSNAADFEGKIVSSENNSPVGFVTILITEDGTMLETDEKGNFQIKNYKGSSATATISHIGFATLQNVILSPDNENVIVLKPSVLVLDNMVVTANRYNREAYKVTQPITVASSTEIETKGHAIVSDVIRTFPGLDMNDGGPFRSRPVIRGLFGTRILVLVDGERINDQRDITSFAGASMSLVDVNEIERVEVVNGPSSVLYGSDAMGGVINIITKKQNHTTGLKSVIKYSGRYSTADEQHSNRFDIGLTNNRLSGSIGFQYREANKDFKVPDGWQDKEEYAVFNAEFYENLNVATGKNFSTDRLPNSRARINNYDAKLSYKHNNNNRLDFDMGAFRGSDIGYPGVPNEATPFWFFYPRHDRDNFSLSYTGTGLTNKLSRLETKVYYQKISKDFLTDFLGSVSFPAGPGLTLSVLNNLNKTEVTKYGLNFQELYSLTKKSTVTFGIDYLREEIDGGSATTTNYDFDTFAFDSTEQSSSVPKNRWDELGIYTAGEMRLDPLLVNLGLRFDNFWITTEETEGYVDDDGAVLPTTDESYSSVNTSVGLVYGLSKSVNLVGNLGTAYRVPNVVERFYYGSASNRETRPNADIKPERSLTVDMGVKAIHDNINYTFIGFYSDYSDFTQLQNFDSLPGHGGSFTPLWRYENIEDVTIYGFESVIEAQIENGMYGNVTFSYQHGENKTDDQPLFVSPFKTSLSMGYRSLKNGYFGEFTVRRAEDQNRIPDVTYLDDIASKGFTVVNMSAGIKLFDSIRFSIAVNNLFDEIYSEPFNGRSPDNPLPEPGRNFIFTVFAGI